MKKKILLSFIVMSLIIILVVTGCREEKEIEDANAEIVNNNLEENLKKDKNDGEKEENENIIEEFREFLKDPPDPYDLIKYIDRNIDRLSPIDGDEMMDNLEKNLKANRINYENRIFDLDKEDELMEISGEEVDFDKTKIDNIKNEELRKVVVELYSSMYKLQSVEGSFYPIIDYGKLKTYKNHITEEWKDYLMIKSMDSDNRTMSDGSLNISFDQLADRILKTENYLNSYIDGQRQEEMLENYSQKIHVYMKGLPNTAIADRNTFEVYEEVLDSYKKTGNNEGYITSHIIYEYFQAIKGNEDIVDDFILERADKLIEEALRMLKEFK